MNWSPVLPGLQSLSQTHARTGEEVQSRQAGFEDLWVPFVPMCPIPSNVSFFLIYQVQTVLFCVPKNLVREPGPISRKGRIGSPKVTNHIGGCLNSGSSQERSQVLPRRSRPSLTGTLACVFVNHLQDHQGALSFNLQL